jgi:ElaB/YqjD/DUF883 family membrane-anchored ribosome-binding protein
VILIKVPVWNRKTGRTLSHKQGKGRIMSSSDSGPRGGAKRPRTEQEIRSEVDELRSQLQNLTSTVTDAASRQIRTSQESLERTIRSNPLAAVGIAAGLGFLYAIIRR